MTNFLLTAFALFLILSPRAQAQEAAQPAANRPADAAAPADDRKTVRRDTFDLVWRTVNENHFDPTFGGVDWAGMRTRYEPLALSAETDVEFYDVLRRMIGELKLSHFAIYPRGAFGAGAEAKKEGEQAGKRGSAGLDVRIIKGQTIITRVEPGSAAERAGLRTGYVIQRVDERDVAAAVARHAASDLSEAYKETYMRNESLSALGGTPGQTRRVTFLDAEDKTSTATLTLTESTDEMSEPFGNFPAVPTQFETRRLGEVGYVRFNIWVASLMPRLRAAVKELSDTRALIFDLRGNPGGLGLMGAGLAGMLIERELALGTMTQRRGHTNFIANPQPGAFRGPVVILIDKLSGSTSEIFALGLQEAGRAVVVGERSAGAALPSMFISLPTGGTFQFAFADFKTPKGVAVEGRGVVPDVTVALDRRALLAGRDPQVEAALETSRRPTPPKPAKR